MLINLSWQAREAGKMIAVLASWEKLVWNDDNECSSGHVEVRSL